MIVHSIAIVLLLLPFLEIPIPPPGPQGILVNLGLPDVGQGDENAPMEPVEEPAASAPEPKPQQPKTPVEQKVSPVPDKKVVATEDPEAIALRQEKARQEEARIKEEAEKQAKIAAEEKRKAEADKKKGEISGLFNASKGKGKGDTGKAGNQGDPEGDPNAEKLKGISTGAGTVGGGLGGRGVLAQPKITDNSQSEGTVVLNVCVDPEGNVISADYTLKGSTTSDATLKSLAVRNAMQWKFQKGKDENKQCGTITYRFKVQ